MAKRDNENFDFETESEGKAKFDLAGFFKNLTKKQKGIILAAVAGIVLVVAIVITFVLIGANSGNGNTNGGGNNISGIRPEEVTGISLVSAPTKNKYYVGDEPDYTGIVVAINSGRGTERRYYDTNPELFSFSGFDSSEVKEELVITVKVYEYTTTFTVSIENAPVIGTTLIGITLKSLPTKTNYVLGDAFDPRGGVILAEYSDGTTEEIELKRNNVSGFSFIETAGEHTVVIKYFDDNGGYAETTLTLTFTE